MATKPLAPDTILFRYMNFGKFVDLLQKKSLWFTRLSEFKDKHEGRFYNRQIERQHLKRALLAHHDESTDDEIERLIEERGLYTDFAEDAVSKYTRSFASCWTIDDEPSDLMWLAYAPNLGVAIQTTIKRLADSLPGIEVHEWDLHHGPCSYEPKDYNPLYQKRPRFKGEREYRVCYSIGYETGQKGCSLPIDLETLLTKVVVSPHSGSDWLREVVKKELELHGLPTVPVELDPQ
jgi:hypothetical protein